MRKDDESSSDEEGGGGEDKEKGKDPEFYDAEEDEENQEWVSSHLSGTPKRQTDAMLSCPACFTLLCADCQRHDEYHNQFRAMFVTPACRVRRGEILTFRDAGDGDKPEDYHPVCCAECGAEVGFFCIADEVFHFISVLASS